MKDFLTIVRCTLILILCFSLPMIGCFFQQQKKDELFHEKAELLDIKRDDDGQYHLLIKKSSGELVTVADDYSKVFLGNYNPHVELPYVKWYNYSDSGILKGWMVNSSDIPLQGIKVYLPSNYIIELFND